MVDGLRAVTKEQWLKLKVGDEIKSLVDMKNCRNLGEVKKVLKITTRPNITIIHYGYTASPNKINCQSADYDTWDLVKFKKVKPTWL